MNLLLASLGMLFAASLAGYLVVRLESEAWPPPGMPPLPGILWASTGLLLLSSLTMHLALGAARAGRQVSLRNLLLLTALLAVAFLGLQGLGWYRLAAAQAPPGANLWAFTFYMLTGLHALHVIGGLLALGTVTGLALAGYYREPGREQGVAALARYWHFLDVVWLILFGVLYLTG
jgi:heme/copper-type cytochrome/quinol oxidase subunit 3